MTTQPSFALLFLDSRHILGPDRSELLSMMRCKLFRAGPFLLVVMLMSLMTSALPHLKNERGEARFTPESLTEQHHSSHWLNEAFYLQQAILPAANSRHYGKAPDKNTLSADSDLLSDLTNLACVILLLATLISVVLRQVVCRDRHWHKRYRFLHLQYRYLQA